MTITVFTSNQPRHTALIESLAAVADQVYAVQECNTVFPGQVPDLFRKSDVMREYFSHVIAAEQRVFGGPRFPGSRRRNVTQFPVKMGDLNLLPVESLSPALSSDLYVIFGATYIKGALCEHLVKHRAVNVHMGISPQYRGSSCNFWALYDRRPDLVGATLHLLTAGLDSGPMLRHALPPADETDGFTLGMLAVRSAHRALIECINRNNLRDLHAVPQERSQQIRYTRNADFTDEVAAEYLSRTHAANEIRQHLSRRDRSQFVRPFIG
jgi:hypothetical protein